MLVSEISAVRVIVVGMLFGAAVTAALSWGSVSTVWAEAKSDGSLNVEVMWQNSAIISSKVMDVRMRGLWEKIL